MIFTRPLLMLRLAAMLIALTGCGLTSDRPAEVDLLSSLPAAERRAAGDPQSAIRADVFVAQGDGRMAIVMKAPSRVTWSVRLPLHARLRGAVAGPGRLRVGMSNGRIYHELRQVAATHAWTPMEIDLQELSEVKWSIFHQPLRMNWHLIFNSDVTADGDVVAVDRPTLFRP